MTEHNPTSNDQPSSPKTTPGDPETAGETTAAATITGPTDTTPVGADTMAKVSVTPQENDKD
jgi:hypothetical protein